MGYAALQGSCEPENGMPSCKVARKRKDAEQYAAALKLADLGGIGQSERQRKFAAWLQGREEPRLRVPECS